MTRSPIRSTRDPHPPPRTSPPPPSRATPRTCPVPEVLTYNSDKAKELWAQADAIAPWDGTFEIAYNSDGGHKEWVDAAANSIKNTLNISAEGKPIVDFKTMLQQEDEKTIGAAFRSGWQADYPSIYNFLQPLYVTGAASNKGFYSSSEFDGLITQAAGAATEDDGIAIMQQAQGTPPQGPAPSSRCGTTTPTAHGTTRSTM